MGTLSAGGSGLEECKAGAEGELKLLAVLSSQWLLLWPVPDCRKKFGVCCGCLPFKLMPCLLHMTQETHEKP